MNDHPQLHGYAAGRPKAFVDAVVAIAMTLLILPLMDSVGEAAASGDSAFTWLLEHRDQLVSFALSFVIIAMFWLSHHRLFTRVERVSEGLLWMLLAWTLSIVWMPVATALSGQMHSLDASAKIVYLSSMIVTALLSLAIRLYLERHAELHEIPREALRRGMSADISLAILFALALALMLFWSPLGYYPMLVMFLSAPLQRWLNRMLGAGERK